MKLKVTLIIVAAITLLTGAVYYFTRPHKKPLLQININRDTGDQVIEQLQDQTEENNVSPLEIKSEEEPLLEGELPQQLTQDKEEEIPAEDKEAISSLVKDLQNAWLTGDVDLFTASLLCSDDNQDYCDERLDNFNKRHQEKNYQSVDYTLEGIEKIGDNLRVYVHESYDYTILSTGDTVLSEVNYVYNFKKDNGAWKRFGSYQN